MARSWFEWVAFILLIIGGLNWAFVAFNFNLVELIFGSISWLLTTVYVLVGLSALYLIFYLTKK